MANNMKPKIVTLCEEIQAFSCEMQVKLDLNKHKGGWDEENIYYLVNRLREESVELNVKINTNSSVRSVIQECADVANFAMMIADNYKRKPI